MKRLEYSLTNDILFKMYFVKHQYLLEILIAEFLDIPHSEITQFQITNTEMLPEYVGDKFCKLDINMIVNEKRINLEIQVADEGNYPERSLYHWAKMYSTALGEGKDYAELPETITINIIDFVLFDCEEFHSEFHILEVSRHARLTDKFTKHFYELKKLPPLAREDKPKELWLRLFKAKTEEDLENIKALEVPIMTQAIEAFGGVATSREFRELERMRSKARHDEAQAIYTAERRGEERANAKWKSVVVDVVAEKDAKISEKDARIAELEAQLNNRNV